MFDVLVTDPSVLQTLLLLQISLSFRLELTVVCDTGVTHMSELQTEAYCCV